MPPGEEQVWMTEITKDKPTNPMPSPEKVLAKRLLGLLFSVISGLSVSVSSVCRKHLSNLPPTQMVIHRYLGVLLYSIPIMIYYHQSLLQSRKPTAILIFRGLCLGIGYMLAFISLNYIPLAEFSVLSACSPLFATIIARIFLGEKCRLIHVFCLILTMLGIVLVSKLPVVLMTRKMPYDLSYYKGIAFTLLVAMLLAVGAATIRVQEVKRLHFSVILFFLAMTSIIESIIVSAAYGYSQLQCGLENWIVIILSLAGIGIDFAGTMALKFQTTSISVMVYSSANIVGSYIWQIAVDGVEPDIYTISGTVAMLLCIFLLTMNQSMSGKVKWKICPCL